MTDQINRKAIAQRAVRLETLTVEYVPTDSINPNSYNPNRQDKDDFALLLRSIREDGFTQPVVVHKETRTIVDGEHRWRAARELGMAELPVVFVDMDAEQMRLSTLRHNRARGSEDVDLTAALYRDLRELGALDQARDALGLSAQELEALLDDTPAPEALAGTEFGQAWVPEGRRYSPTEGEESTEGVRTPTLEGSTPAALAQIQAAQERLDSATTEEERTAALNDRGNAVYRISLAFRGEEAEVIKAALGEHPAERLLELCRAREARGPVEATA